MESFIDANIQTKKTKSSLLYIKYIKLYKKLTQT
ncbi:hypothetical protein EDD80_11661 [Anseongella ginsenosidimutans]|uniref:Uncharacterized protein n=1 Tax=Anseongella ginsenosidimutans TaxID=496056 RepID=A0A4R3KLJ6_9SPHI|nr:hypothetical protein EDD80_11661 [Anseongella ginsenosidimutans]